jgi:hypothetical protein
LTGLKAKFLERFNFLREACQHWGEAETVPNINFKEGGILNLWMELTPEHSRTTFKVELVNGKFKSMEDFMTKYFIIVDKISILSEKSKAYHHMVNLTQLKKGTPQQRSQRTRRETSTLDDALDEWTQDEDSVEAPREVKGGLAEDEDCGTQELHHLRLTQTSDKAVCHRMMLYGKCDGPCNYDHSPSKIDSERERLAYSWRREKEREDPMKVDPVVPKILRRNHPGYQYPGEKPD